MKKERGEKKPAVKKVVDLNTPKQLTISLRELERKLNYSSKATLARHLTEAVYKGFIIELVKGKGRFALTTYAYPSDCKAMLEQTSNRIITPVELAMSYPGSKDNPNHPNGF